MAADYVFKPGDRVVVLDGAFHGRGGTVEKTIPGKNSAHNLIVVNLDGLPTTRQVIWVQAESLGLATI